MKKIDPELLKARAFGEDPVEDKVESKENDTAEASQAESVEDKDKATSEPKEPVVEEQKVPYSRLKTVVERARVAEQKAQEAERRYQELESKRDVRRSDEPYEKAISDRIKKLYGDNDTSKEIIEIELARQREIEDMAERKAIEALDRRETSSRSEIESNERVLEEKLEDFSLTLGRDLTKTEEDELLAIADQYSPTGEDGKYLSGEPLPLDRAWEIYEMKLASKGQSSKRSRSEATALTSSKTEGEADTKEGDSEGWFPGRWRNRFGK
jgi:hypothetical protein